MTPLRPQARPTLIGSLPLDDHRQAVDLIFSQINEIPLWPQLPVFSNEKMIPQFLPGMPGLVQGEKGEFINMAAADAEAEVLAFYEAYMAVLEDDKIAQAGRFSLSPEVAGGLFAFMEKLATADLPLKAVKGQITGPVTLGMGTKNQDGRAIFYDDQYRDIAVKLLALKARWQVRQLSDFGVPVIIFIDEPALTGFGSSEMISVSNQDVLSALTEIIDIIHAEGACAGVHVCGNTDWGLVMASGTDIVNFDAYSYFDKFLLFPDAIKTFIQNGGNIAWGLVPTLHPEDIEKVDADGLFASWQEKTAAMAALGIDETAIFEQSLITPACGTGALKRSQAERVLTLTRQVSDRIREKG